MLDTEIAWAAGLFEGEGSTGTKRNGTVCLGINMTDRDVIEKINQLYPGNKISIRPPALPHHLTQYCWGFTRATKIRDFLSDVMPFLGERRRQRAEKVLDYIYNRPRHVPFVPLREIPLTPEIQNAWVAGLFEGEGCISFHATGKGVSVKMTDRDIVDRLDAIFPSPTGVKTRKTTLPDTCKDQYLWYLARPEMIRGFLRATMPYFGERRTAKARDLLAYLDSRPGQGTFNREKTHCPRGHPYDEENTLRLSGNRRGCKACQRIYKMNAKLNRQQTVLL